MNDILDQIREAGEQISKNIADVVEDFKKQINDAYQKGLEDGKKSGYEKGLNAVGTYRKGHAIGYEEGYEDGKKSGDKGCEGCRYVLRFANDDPCKNCSNCYTSKYEPMPKDEICFGDEIVVNGERGVVVSHENEGSNAIWALLNGYRTPQIVENNYAKTGRHFGIEEIMEAMGK